jgi:Bacterial protein of unknown function (DUF916).
MRILYPFSGHRMYLHISAFVFTITVLLINIAGISVAYATGSPLNLDLRPVFFDSRNPVSKAYFVMDSRPATVVQNSLRLINMDTHSGTVKLYPVDAFTDPTGGTDYYANKDARHDVGAWIKLSRQQVTLSPGQIIDVPFKVVIPDHVRSGQHVGGIVAQDLATQVFSSKNKKIHLTLQQRRILAVQVNLPGRPVEQLVATGIRFDKASTYQRVLTVLRNTGNMMIKPIGNLRISDLHGHLLQSQEVHIQTFLPQTSIDYPVYIHNKALPIGRYHVSLSLTYGHAQKLSYTTIFMVNAQKKTLPNAVAALISGDENFLNLLSPWQLAVSGFILLLIICGVLFSLYKLCMLIARFSTKRVKATATDKGNDQETEEAVYSDVVPGREPIYTRGHDDNSSSTDPR